jgi:hypothetical protein
MALGPAEKLERLFGMSLDDLFEIMSWPIGELDPFRLSVRMQVTRVVFAICLKAFLDGSLGREAARERDRERVFAEMARDLERLRQAGQGLRPTHRLSFGEEGAEVYWGKSGLAGGGAKI